MFADDTNIFVEGETVEEAYTKSNNLLCVLQKYMILNKLHINMAKCCYIHFKPKCAQVPDYPLPILSIDQFPIKRSQKHVF